MDLKVPFKDKEKWKEYYKINKEKISLQNKEYYIKNRERIKNCQKIYNESHKEDKAIYDKEYYKINKERISICNKGYYHINKEKRSKIIKKWKEENPEKRRQYFLNQQERKKDWGIEPINEYFKGAHFHHMHVDENHSVGIYIPADLHRSIQHKYNDKDSMNNINRIAIKWYS